MKATFESKNQMRTTVLGLCVFLLVSWATPTLAQSSYGAMESRFVKSTPTSADSAAFTKQGLQKAQSLFAQTDLYYRNANNSSNQTYIAERIPALFYVPKGDSLDLKPLLRAIETIQQSKKYKEPKFTINEAPGYLAEIETTNTKPKLAFKLVLIKAPKQFGDQEEMVWQVFLAAPEIVER